MCRLVEKENETHSDVGLFFILLSVYEAHSFTVDDTRILREQGMSEMSEHKDEAQGGVELDGEDVDDDER